MKNQSKQQRYEALVAKRKADTYTQAFDYQNQSQSKYDTDEIGNWSLWANDLNADIMVIGQDYCDIDSFEGCEGLVEKGPILNPEQPKEWATNTNYYLWLLLKSIGRDIGLPILGQKKSAGVFLTNAVLDLKPGKMTAKLNRKVSDYSGETYLKPLIELVEPKQIYTLGKHATQGLLRLFSEENPNLKNRSANSMATNFKDGSFSIRKGKTRVHPVFHPGALGQSGRKRISSEKDKSGWELMKGDWEKANTI